MLCLFKAENISECNIDVDGFDVFLTIRSLLTLNNDFGIGK